MLVLSENKIGEDLNTVVDIEFCSRVKVKAEFILTTIIYRERSPAGFVLSSVLHFSMRRIK